MPDETFYDFADFRLDAGRRLLSHRTHGPVAITSRAFDALLHFVRNPERIAWVTGQSKISVVEGTGVSRAASRF